MKPVKTPGVLRQGSPPGDRHGEEERVQALVVKALSEVATGRHDHPLVLPPTQDNDVLGEAGEPIGQRFQMNRSFGDGNRRAPSLQGGQHIIEDQLVATLVAGERAIDVPDRNRRRGRLTVRHAKGCLPNADTVIERPPRRLCARIDTFANRPALHEDDRMVTSFRVTVADSPRTYRAFVRLATSSKLTAERW